MIYFIQACLFSSLILLAGCSGVKKSLGLNRKNNDEFSIFKNEPLVIPPDFHLRPPKETSLETNKSSDDSAQLKEEIFKEKQPNSDKQSDAELSLLEMANKDDQQEVDANIRKQVDNEAAKRERASSSKLAKFIPWQSKKDEEILDPQIESDRLQRKKSA